jgi:hypothetical protein
MSLHEDEGDKEGSKLILAFTLRHNAIWFWTWDLSSRGIGSGEIFVGKRDRKEAEH